jgi:Lon protease-like protein
MLEIPLFPLHTVLFPGMPLQLHIFEERYKKMVAYCQRTESPFGVVLIHQGVEALGPLATPFNIGCTAQIIKLAPLEQGRYDLSAIGLERFRIQALKQDQPYLVGVIEEFPLRIDDHSGVIKAESRLRPWLERYVRNLTQDESVELAITHFPEDPISLAYLAAMVVQIPPSQKQALLEIEQCLELLERMHPLYRREVALVESIIRSQPVDLTQPFSKN